MQQSSIAQYLYKSILCCISTACAHFLATYICRIWFQWHLWINPVSTHCIIDDPFHCDLNCIAAITLITLIVITLIHHSKTQFPWQLTMHAKCVLSLKDKVFLFFFQQLDHPLFTSYSAQRLKPSQILLLRIMTCKVNCKGLFKTIYYRNKLLL